MGRSTLAAFLVLAACAPPEPTDPEVVASAATAGGAALLVVGNTSLAPGDAALKARLQALQLTVAVKSGPAVQAGDATGKVVVVISDTVTSADVNTKLRDVATPVLCLEPALFDDMRLSGPTVGTDFGTQGSQREITLAAVSHPLAEGLNLPATTAASTYGWARPVPGATIIATLAGSDRAALFAFATGQPLFGALPAPARRVGAFMTGATPQVFTAQAWRLFDNAVRWLTEGCRTDAECPGNHACLNGRCTTTCGVTFKACAGNVCVPSNACCPGQKMCGSGQCVATTACCVDSECPAPPNTISRCLNNACQAPVCAPGAKMCADNSCIPSTACCQGQKSCNGQCIPATACCTDGDCPAPANMISVCQNQACQPPVCSPSFTFCSPNTCVPAGTCCPGQRSCGGQCIPGTACCTSMECAMGQVCDPTHRCVAAP